MKNPPTANRLAFLLLLALFVGSAYAINYMWITNHERTNFWDELQNPYFWSEDTFRGPVHSNDTFAIVENPVYYDLLTTHAPVFWQGPGYNPQFHGPPPVFRAPLIEFPEQLTYYRTTATHTFAPGVFQQMRCIMHDNQAIIYHWPLGVAFDSANVVFEAVVVLGQGTILFFEGPLELMGRDVVGDVVIASSSRIRVMDDVRVAGINANHEVPEDNPNFLTIATEGEIKIADTWANGHANSNGAGQGQTDPELTDVVLTANIYALGQSLTFEHQNDPDSGYVCDCWPDVRGTLYIFGALCQRRRGYIHRSNLEATGYRLHLRWDERLRSRPNVVFDDPYEEQSTDSLDFGNVPLGQTVTDTAEIFVNGYNALGAAMASLPFEADRVEPFFGSYFIVPVHFSPPQTGTFNGVLQVSTSSRFFQIPLHAVGVPGGGPRIAAHPNPFNNSTNISFTIETAGRVTIELYDILGRRALTLMDENVLPGAHSLSLNASALSSGLYFAHIRTPSQQQTLKLMLVK